MSNNVIYNIGLDLGTNSIGWSVTANDYRIIKKGDKKLWGVVLFESGNSSKEYRAFRNARRRFARRRVRINLLQNLFSNSIAEVDPTFFKRLNMSYLCNNSIDTKTGRSYKYNLFNDVLLNDVTYNKMFKTIYHLRNYLINSNKKEDIRLVYLALHHIAKYRGNFLHQEEELVINCDNIKQEIEYLLKEYLEFESIDAEKIASELMKKNVSKKDKSNSISKLFSNKDLGSLISKLFVGYSIDSKLIKKAFSIGDSIEEIKLQFGKDDFDVNFDLLSRYISSEYLDMIAFIKTIYEDLMLIDILGEGNKTVSIAMINRYNQHNLDLLNLKQILKNNKKIYYEMFKNDKSTCNYVSYVNKSDKGNKAGKPKCNREDFYNFVKKCLNQIEDSLIKQNILQSIDQESFMPLINDVINSNIPYQLNYNEAKMILDKQSIYYPELKENYFKILSIIKFRRPYSVGVINSNSKFSWLDESPNEKVFPWNFNEIIDLNKANENFIKKTLSRDVYTGEFVLPLESITYQKYIVLNEINNIRYKGEPLHIDIKKKVFNIFTNKISVSCVDIVKVFKSEINIDCSIEDFTGFLDSDNMKFISSMKTYIKLKKLFGNDYKDADVKLYDKIVENLIVFKDRNILQHTLEVLFTSTAHSYLIKYIPQLLKMNFAGWGKYSYQLLEGLLSKDNNPQSINDILYNTNNNFMQIVNEPRYGFKEMFEKTKTIENPNYENLISPLYASAPVKKTVWNVYKVVAEIVKIMGCEPKNIFIETTREANEKKKTVTRWDALNCLYKNLSNETEKYNINALKDELNNNVLDKDKLFLYFLQLGRCMYTLQPIDINRLDEYEIDHIVPRCFIKDDSFDNRVLVCKNANQRKSDLAISDEIRNKCKDFWLFLYKHGNKNSQFMSKKKYDNLMRTSWDESTISGFINRQLVETTQINKLTRDVLSIVYPNLINNIKFVNSGLVSLFRNYQASIDYDKFGNFLKIRDINDLHHAKDAYLVSVFGIFTSEYYCAWGKEERALLAKNLLNGGMSKSSTKELINERYGVIIDKLKSHGYECCTIDGEYITGEKAFDNIITMMDFNDISIVKLKEEYANSSFYNQTIYSPKCNKELFYRKMIKLEDNNCIKLDPKLYGGYSNVNAAYYLFVSYTKNKTRVSKLVGVPVIIAEQSKNASSNSPIVSYLKGIGLEEPTIESKPIKKYQLIIYHGQNVYITGESELINAQQLIVDKKYSYLLKCICENKKEKIDKMNDFYELTIGFINEYIKKIKKYFPLYETIANKIDEFVKCGINGLSKEELCTYVTYLLKITHSGASRIDMPTEWNGGSGWGRLSKKSISKNDEDILWVDKSITGYYISKN